MRTPRPHAPAPASARTPGPNAPLSEVPEVDASGTGWHLPINTILSQSLAPSLFFLQSLRPCSQGVPAPSSSSFLFIPTAPTAFGAAWQRRQRRARPDRPDETAETATAIDTKAETEAEAGQRLRLRPRLAENEGRPELQPSPHPLPPPPPSPQPQPLPQPPPLPLSSLPSQPQRSAASVKLDEWLLAIMAEDDTEVMMRLAAQMAAKQQAYK